MVQRHAPNFEEATVRNFVAVVVSNFPEAPLPPSRAVGEVAGPCKAAMDAVNLSIKSEREEGRQLGGSIQRTVTARTYISSQAPAPTSVRVNELIHFPPCAIWTSTR